MGTLIYGRAVEVELPDLSLLHLDMLLAEYPGAAFQLHLVLAGAEDGDLLSLSVGSGAPLALKFGNQMPDGPVDVDVMRKLAEGLQAGLVSLPMLPAAKSPDPYTA